MLYAGQRCALPAILSGNQVVLKTSSHHHHFFKCRPLTLQFGGWDNIVGIWLSFSKWPIVIERSRWWYHLDRGGPKKKYLSEISGSGPLRPLWKIYIQDNNYWLWTVLDHFGSSGNKMISPKPKISERHFLPWHTVAIRIANLCLLFPNLQKMLIALYSPCRSVGWLVGWRHH